MLWCGEALARAGIPTPLPYDQKQMWARGDDGNEWFLTSQHELTYLILREKTGNFLVEAGEDQNTILRLHPTPLGHGIGSGPRCRSPRA